MSRVRLVSSPAEFAWFASRFSLLGQGVRVAFERPPTEIIGARADRADRRVVSALPLLNWYSIARRMGIMGSLFLNSQFAEIQRIN